MNAMAVPTARGDFYTWLRQTSAARAHSLFLFVVLVTCVAGFTLLDTHDHGKSSPQNGDRMLPRQAMESLQWKARTTGERSGDGFAVIFSQYTVKTRKVAVPEPKPHFETLNAPFGRGMLFAQERTPGDVALPQLAPVAVVKMSRKQISNDVNRDSNNLFNRSSRPFRTVAFSPISTLFRHLVISRLKNGTAKGRLGFDSMGNAFGSSGFQEIASVAPRNRDKFSPFPYFDQDRSKSSKNPLVPEAPVNLGRSERFIPSGNHPIMLLLSMLNASPRGRPAFASIDNQRSWGRIGGRSLPFGLSASRDLKRPVDVETSYNINVLTIESFSQGHEKSRFWHFHSDELFFELVVLIAVFCAVLSCLVAFHSRRRKCVPALFPLASV
ncbi:uncharacterized protein LOC135370324 [Ornithodoros turicata]|uniref:uncharacterized protein LOC135370324 n=1 Tax=Ornithodoros turicata TaxID=34597 RepID=UPI003139F87B